MIVPNEIRNRLALAIETTANPPYMGRAIHADRQRVEREYRDLHQTLQMIDRLFRGWEPPK